MKANNCQGHPTEEKLEGHAGHPGLRIPSQNALTPISASDPFFYMRKLECQPLIVRHLMGLLGHLESLLGYVSCDLCI